MMIVLIIGKKLRVRKIVWKMFELRKGFTPRAATSGLPKNLGRSSIALLNVILDLLAQKFSNPLLSCIEISINNGPEENDRDILLNELPESSEIESIIVNTKSANWRHLRPGE
jgi:hypothetical protein